VEQSIPQQIRTRVINMTVGQWMRSIDFILSDYQSQQRSIDEEAEHVAKLAVLVMLTRWYNEEDIVMLLDSTSLQLPAKLSQTSQFELAKILDRPSDEERIEDFEHDDNAPPMHKPDGAYELKIDDEDDPEFIPPY